MLELFEFNFGFSIYLKVSYLSKFCFYQMLVQGNLHGVLL